MDDKPQVGDIVWYSVGDDTTRQQAEIIGNSGSTHATIKLLTGPQKGQEISAPWGIISPLEESLGQPPIDYEIEPNGEIVKHLSLRLTQRGSGTTYPQIGARLAFKTKHDTAEFVRAGEREGYTFEGKEFIAGY